MISIEQILELIEEDRLLEFVPRACLRDFEAELRIQLRRVYNHGFHEGWAHNDSIS